MQQTQILPQDRNPFRQARSILPRKFKFTSIRLRLRHHGSAALIEVDIVELPLPSGIFKPL